MVMAIFNPRNNFMISKNDGLFDNSVNHQRDTLINSNSMIQLSRHNYRREWIDHIKDLQKTNPPMHSDMETIFNAQAKH